MYCYVKLVAAYRVGEFDRQLAENGSKQLMLIRPVSAAETHYSTPMMHARLRLFVFMH